MKKARLLLFLLTLYLPGFAIDFYPGTYKEALEKAAQENKNIFIYFTAKWCGPCQYMLRDVFPDPVLTQYVADNYIAFKADIDFPEGKEVYLKCFQSKVVAGIPGFIIMNPKEEVVLRKAIGAMKLSQLKEFLRRDNDEKNIFKELSARAELNVKKVERITEKIKGSGAVTKFIFYNGASAWRMGIKAGANITHYSGSLSAKGSVPGYEFAFIVDKSFKSKTNLNPFWNISRYSFQPGLMLSSKGGNTLTEKINIHYLELDFFNNYIIKGAKGLMLSFSPYAALALWGKEKLSPGNKNISFGKDFSRYDYGIKAGLSMRTGDFEPYIGYNVGLHNFNLNNNGALRNKGFYVSLAMIVGK